MEQVYVKTRIEWRRWLSENHEKVEKGIWLLFYKKKTGLPTLDYDAAVEEALCFGWIDSIVKTINSEQYVRKFSPRKLNSNWSDLNKRRAKKAIREGRMTEHGLVKIAAAKKLGCWKLDPRLRSELEPNREFKNALAKNKKAKDFFEHLPPSSRKHFVGWVNVAKRDETKQKRIRESIVLLEEGKRLWVK